MLSVGMPSGRTQLLTWDLMAKRTLPLSGLQDIVAAARNTPQNLETGLLRIYIYIKIYTGLVLMGHELGPDES